MVVGDQHAHGRSLAQRQDRAARTAEATGPECV
jgi:hypothetical protein